MDALYQITNKESGIIIYHDSTALMTNWLFIDGLPRIFAGTVIGLGEELEVLETKELSKEEIKQIVSDIQDTLIIISDTDNEITPDNVTSKGKLYKIKNGNDIASIITIDDWN